ncbi:hypothetical protein B4N89_41970 [Embleya scabrispora]|uniref:Neocarzinostatin family protein n=1 Tax=Embleya scabrispora TaxID=159449 RepID=A0A1T3NKA2_9ACTN|nr:neocarzinostatin apoprotein domain-containing protein [Embleya scabrispora]OPC77130.1 hypothetical protein B4N89_41970 [Embleya scabrispora]
MDVPFAHRLPRLALMLATPALLGTLAASPAIAQPSPGPADDGRPTLTADRADALDPADDRITVTGHGFRPGTQVRVTACDPAQEPGKACDSERAEDGVRAGPDGSFARQLRLRAAFGPVDCLRTRCAVAATEVDGAGARGRDAYLPIGFRGETPGLPATWAPAPATTPGGEGSSPASPRTASPSSSVDSATSTAQDNDAHRNPWVLPAVMVGVIAVIAVIVVFVLRNRRQAGTGRGSGDK